MPFELFFPGHEDDFGSYKDLMDEEDVYAAIMDETKKAISDMGSDGYEPVMPDDWDQMSEEEKMEATGEAHQKGIDAAAHLACPGIHKELWIRYRSHEGGESDIAIDNTTYSALPDGTKIGLREYED